MLDSEYILLPPKKVLKINHQLQRKLVAALVTGYSPDNLQMKISIATTSRHMPTNLCKWGQAQVHGSGDQFKCCVLLKGQQWMCDCTYVKVSKAPVFCYTHPTNHEMISMKPKLTFTNIRSTGCL